MYFVYSVNLKTADVFAYESYGVNCAEVELDVLTGEIEIVRSDILFDCGQRWVFVYVNLSFYWDQLVNGLVYFSINPEIDIGQVEGAYVMGLGYWLTERFVYDEDSGEVLTHNTWVWYIVTVYIATWIKVSTSL